LEQCPWLPWHKAVKRLRSCKNVFSSLASKLNQSNADENDFETGGDMGLPAARITDMHVCPMVTGIVPHVGGPILPPGGIPTLIGGLPAARVGDMCVCVGPPDVIALGSFTTFIGKMPAARMGDMTAHGGAIVMGFPTVIIG
jgi:uncharacterized Zn-binding protein involved in type VI secretion